MNKKKIIMPVCMAAMAMSMMTGGMIHADEETTALFTGEDASKTIEVNANITKSQSVGSTSTVYRADIAWTVPTLTATQAANSNAYVWDPATTSYKIPTVTTSSTLTSAEEGTVKITVTNKSNADISYSISNSVATGYTFDSAKSPVSKAATTIAAADEQTDTTSGARSMMLAGSSNTTKLTGTAVSDTFTNTIKLATAPLQSVGDDNVSKVNANKSVVKYTVAITKASQ